MDVIAAALDFAAYFGHNRNALVDGLRDIETATELIGKDAGVCLLQCFQSDLRIACDPLSRRQKLEIVGGAGARAIDRTLL
jgi:Barstar (barnase inhibitor)